MGIEPLALASLLRWGTQAGAWSRLGGHGGITAAGDGGALPQDCQTMWAGEWQLLPCELWLVSPLPFVGTGAQNKQALVDWMLAVTLLLTCCVTLAKSPASSELLGVLIYLYWTNNPHCEPHMRRGAEKQQQRSWKRRVFTNCKLPGRCKVALVTETCPQFPFHPLPFSSVCQGQGLPLPMTQACAETRQPAVK